MLSCQCRGSAIYVLRNTEYNSGNAPAVRAGSLLHPITRCWCEPCFDWHRVAGLSSDFTRLVLIRRGAGQSSHFNGRRRRFSRPDRIDLDHALLESQHTPTQQDKKVFPSS
ncbi:unnamed protein product [Ectocarpus sp. 12 AP-2014]